MRKDSGEPARSSFGNTDAVCRSTQWPLYICCFGSNVLQNHAAQMAPQARGTAVSLFSCVLFLGQSFGIALGAWSIGHASVRILFAVCALGLLALAVVFAHLLTARHAPQMPGVLE